MKNDRTFEESAYEKTRSASEKIEENYKKMYKAIGVGSYADSIMRVSSRSNKLIENALKLNDIVSSTEKFRLSEIAKLNMSINKTYKLLQNNNFNLYNNASKQLENNLSLKLLESSTSNLVRKYFGEGLNLKSSKLYGQQYASARIINNIQSIENMKYDYDIFKKINIDNMPKYSISSMMLDNKIQQYMKPILKSDELRKTVEFQQSQLTRILEESSKFYINDKLINLSSVTRTLEPSVNRILSDITEVKAIRNIAEKRFEKAVNILKEFGWWGISSLSFKTYIEIEKQDDIVDVNEINKIICDFYSKDNFENLESLLLKWKENKYFNRVSEILEDAVEAHKNGKYTLSIPALMPNIEGIIRYFMSDKYGISKRSFAPIYKEFKDNVKGFEDIMAVYVIQYIDKLFCNFDPENPNEVDDFSRHKLLHGFSSHYHSEVNSLKIILYLDEIYNIIEKLSMEKIAS